jgi:hypothetical protein
MIPMQNFFAHECENDQNVWHNATDSSRGRARDGRRGGRPFINVPRRRGLSPGTGDAVLIAYAVRRKGGNTVASKEEGGEEGGEESRQEKRKEEVSSK